MKSKKILLLIHGTHRQFLLLILFFQFEFSFAFLRAGACPEVQAEGSHPKGVSVLRFCFCSYNHKSKITNHNSQLNHRSSFHQPHQILS